MRQRLEMLKISSPLSSRVFPHCYPAMGAPPSHLFVLLLLLLFLSLFHDSSANRTPVFFASVASPNPFTAKASLLRYWSRKLPSSTTRPLFLVSKLSPLSAPDSAALFSLPSRLPAFCSAAQILCTPIPTSFLHSQSSDSNFANYQTINFTNYGTGHVLGGDSFANYSDNLKAPIGSFRQYSRDSTSHDDAFTSYSAISSEATDNFTSYATGANGGAGDFTFYAKSTNIPNENFISYETESNGRVQNFTSYSDDSNVGDQSFVGYGKHGNAIPTSFTSYAKDSNVINSDFNGYGEDANAANHTFTSYGFTGNIPENHFKAYGENGNSGSEKFTSYINQSNGGVDTFTSYAKGGSSGTAEFVNYGNRYNTGRNSFKGYGEGAVNLNISFKSYLAVINSNNNFKGYAKSGVDFKTYKNAFKTYDVKVAGAPAMGIHWVEPGKFFRESSLKKGTVMPMPDIRDKMPARSFLPRSIAGRIPFSAVDVTGLLGIPADSAMGKAVANTVAECRRPPSRGETKRCATSAEDVIDFAAEILGGGATARSTESAEGSRGVIFIGDVRGLGGGKLTRAVSCHQSLFPYLVYYCHSVPKVRVYEAEILAVGSKRKINHGVAICHVDTSDWSAGHGAFVALGSAPGKIEVCHWIFQGDMTWTVAD